MAVTVKFYGRALEYIGDNSIDLDGDTFKLMLMSSAHTFDIRHTTKASINGNQISGNGYPAGGVALSGVTWVPTGSAAPTTAEVVFDATNVQFNASGGSITARYAILYDDTHASDLLVCQIDFGQNESAGDGTAFLVRWNASGVFKAGAVQ